VPTKPKAAISEARIISKILRIEVFLLGVVRLAGRAQRSRLSQRLGFSDDQKSGYAQPR
jgi:hypothetical protein